MWWTQSSSACTRKRTLAVIKIEETGLPTLSFSSARRVQQGQLVVAIGSPRGLDNTVTMGIVSSRRQAARSDSPLVYIQTDAPIKSGQQRRPVD